MMPSFSSTVRSLLIGLLQKDPKKRLGFNGAEEVKNHPFFKGIDWDDLKSMNYRPFHEPNCKD